METWKAKDVLPAEIDGRGPAAPPEVFVPSDLYKYLNGGAAAYLAYDFQELAVASYPIGSGNETVLVEIYRMGKSEDAFGLYSDGAEGEHPQVGQDASYGAGLLRFWKGYAFVRILWLSEESDPRDKIVAIGTDIDSRVPEAGKRPRLLRALPPEGLVADRAIYFHTVISLNQLYYLSDGNPLGLGAQTDAVFAEYEIGERAPKILVVRYTNEREAAMAFEKFEAVYLADRPPDGGSRRADDATSARIELLEDGLAVGMLRERQLLALCFEAEPIQAQALLDKTAALYRTEFGEDKKAGGE
ncbi:hypothetical protein AMJ85_04945 [candidate division BRC1 bacterium SM23_51]|nr:MAG: hypothetical protein AMJ85_04945 [candidate division BRC1 bacterium SM23_51]